MGGRGRNARNVSMCVVWMGEEKEKAGGGGGGGEREEQDGTSVSEGRVGGVGRRREVETRALRKRGEETWCGRTGPQTT